jgi:hypothetical protein
VSYRPICDVWILARSKVKYYGAYPAGFLHRARAVLGVGPQDAVLHVCGGRVKDYPYRGFGPNDKTLDLDPALSPDFLQDARKPFPLRVCGGEWDAVLIDRPYSVDDAVHYAPGADKLPEANALLRGGLSVVKPGGRVGFLDYVWPHPGKRGQEVAVVAVGTGRNNRARWFTVFEKVAES